MRQPVRSLRRDAHMHAKDRGRVRVQRGGRKLGDRAGGAGGWCCVVCARGSRKMMVPWEWQRKTDIDHSDRAGWQVCERACRSCTTLYGAGDVENSSQRMPCHQSPLNIKVCHGGKREIMWAHFMILRFVSDGDQEQTPGGSTSCGEHLALVLAQKRSARCFARAWSVASRPVRARAK